MDISLFKMYHKNYYQSYASIYYKLISLIRHHGILILKLCYIYYNASYEIFLYYNTNDHLVGEVEYKLTDQILCILQHLHTYITNIIINYKTQ